MAACVTNASNNVTCDGAIPAGAGGYPITLYDQAAAFQPTNGSNAYTPANPAFPAASNPSTPGYNPSPATEIVTINPGASFNVNVTTANRTTVTTDGGVITANYSNSESPAVNNVTVNNSGSIFLTNTQSGSRISAIVADSQVNNFTVNNNAGGAIAVSQTSFPTFSTSNLSVTSSGTPATFAARYSGSTLAITSDFYSDDNTEAFVVNNAANANVLAIGSYATTYYGRADTTINNSGTLANTSWTSSDTIAAGHWAIAAYAGTEYVTAANTNPDSNIVIPNADGSVTVNDTSALTLTNKTGGFIKGDILALDITPLVYAAAVGSSTNPFPNPTQTTLLQLPVSSSSGGPRDSNIVNQGTIQGNFYLGSGAHVIENTAGASLQGSVYVDQRPFQVSFSEPNPGTLAGTYVSKGGADFNGTACATAGQNTTNPGCATTSNHIATVVGDQSLTLTNKGTFTGDIRIFDEATSVNSITLRGTGFSGNIQAVNGTGSNTIVLHGVTNLASVSNFSALNLNQSNVTVPGGVSLVNNATIKTTVYGRGGTVGSPSTNVGTINGTLTLAGATTLTPKFKTLVHNDNVYQVTSSETGGPVSVTQTGSFLVKASADTSNGNLLLETHVTDGRNISGLSLPAGATLQGLLSYDGKDPQVIALGTLVEGLKTADQVRQAAVALAPITNGADVQTPINSVALFNQALDSRLDSFIYAQIPSSGRSADLGVAHPVPVYGALPTNGTWIEGIGGGINQKTDGGVSGYNASLAGAIGGYDRLIVPGLRIGGAFGYIDGRVNGNANVGTREDVQTYQGLAYATYEQPNYYLRGSVAYGGLHFQDTRQVAFGGFSGIAVGSHSGNIFSTRGEVGIPYEYLSSLFVPYAAFGYSHLQQAAYTESGGGGAALSYAAANNDSERSEVGGKVVVPIGTLPVFSYLFPSGSVVALEGHAAYVHEFGNVAQNVAASFVGGGNVFVATGPAPSRDMVDYGVGLRMGSGPVQIDISYNGLARSTYLQQVGMLRARYLF